jgi:hypothetical protein
VARGLHLGASHIAALDAHVQAMRDAVYEAANIATDHIEQSVQRRAAASPQWAPISEHILIASQDGYLTIGVAPEFESEAVAAEYGTQYDPPSPLLRTAHTASRGAAAAADQYLESKFGRR